MSENEDTRMILHRVVFYDLLSTPDIDSQRDTYGKIHEAHLSIPMMPGLETVWAPNGYGKVRHSQCRCLKECGNQQNTVPTNGQFVVVYTGSVISLGNVKQWF